VAPQLRQRAVAADCHLHLNHLKTPAQLLLQGQVIFDHQQLLLAHLNTPRSNRGLAG
jgi:hypothetical protein